MFGRNFVKRSVIVTWGNYLPAAYRLLKFRREFRYEEERILRTRLQHADCRLGDTRGCALCAGRPAVPDRDWVDSTRRNDDRSGWKLFQLAGVVGNPTTDYA